MNAILRIWNRLEPMARFGIAAGTLGILALSSWVGYATMHTDYEVLFSQLNQGDAAAIVDQLKRQKAIYRIGEDGTSIEVPRAEVHETRLKLMSSGVPLSGGVGFEIFDKQGLGATEQSQRVSYQRALQGELARTVSTLNDVKQVRVHLVLPESTLFKRDRQEARAAVTLAMRPGAALTREQISGVQRLVAASVAGLDPGRVVITDQRGITLSGPDSLGGNGAVVSEARLGMKREIEEYVTRKVAKLLDSTYGPGQAIVSADVSLNFDEIRRTVQGVQPSGVRRKRQTLSNGAAATAVMDAAEDSPTLPSSGNSSTEVEYEYGRSVEQVIAAPGGITRLSIGVIVPGDLTQEKQKRITDLVRVAAGINEQRGDAVVVQPLDQLGVHPAAANTLGTPEAVAPIVVEKSAVKATPLHLSTPQNAAAVAGLVLAVLIAFAFLFRRGLKGRASATQPVPLSPAERQSLLLEIEKALGESPSLAGSRAVP